MSKKQLYVKLSDGEDISNLIMMVSGVEAWIEADEESRGETDEPKEYTLVPIWLTEEEFNALPEAEF